MKQEAKVMKLFFTLSQCDNIWRNFVAFSTIPRLWQFFRVYFSLLWQKLMLLGKNYSFEVAKYWTNTIAIWSHCSLTSKISSKIINFLKIEKFLTKACWSQCLKQILFYAEIKHSHWIFHVTWQFLKSLSWTRNNT